jgi:IS30 family transposase|tara:strand:+ start:50 stop:529 length:480 start_codon:yes stop_codon:yes gene_type:complete
LIAKVIGVDKSTVSRELKRNSGKRGYRPKQVNAFAKDIQQGKSEDRLDNITWSFIKLLIENDWFPEQIQDWMKEHLSYSVSHEWIYQYILKDKQAGGSLYLHPRCKKKTKKRYGSNDRRTKENTEDAIKRLLSSISGQVHTITSDNGKELANHEKIAKR